MDIKPPLKYEIRRKSIPNLKLYPVDKPYWFNSLGGLLELTNTDLIDSLDGYIIYNVTGGTVSSGYYVWSGETLDGTSYGDTDCDLSLKLYEWESISKSEAYDDHDIPLFLESSVDEMGVMVGFDGQIEQVEQICNFSYTQTGNTVYVYNTIDTTKVSEIYDINFIVDWGDGTSSILTTTGITANKTYSSTGVTTISISINTPWTQFETKKIIQIPSNTTVPNPLGTFSGFTIPYTNITGQTQDYLNDYDSDCDGTYTGNTIFYYASIGKSRINEKKLYGGNTYTGVTTGITNNLVYSPYTIDDLSYRDFEDGVTTIYWHNIWFYKRRSD